MKNKLLILLLSTSGFILTARAAVYLEPRVSHLMIGGTPDVGDIGREIDSDLPPVSVGVAVGYEISPRISLELRYTHLGNLTISKQSPNRQIFPTDNITVILPAVARYDFAQRTQLFAAGLRFKVWTKDKLSLQLTPLLQVEKAEVELLDAHLFPPLPYVSTVAGSGPVFFRRSTTTVQAGAEIALSYRLNDRAAVQLHYTYSPLSNFDAHLLGAGLQVKF